MRSIEEIANAFEGLSPAQHNQWNVASIVPSRLHISRDQGGAYAVFLEGEAASFGKLPTVGGLEHSAQITVLPASRTFAALRMTSGDEVHGNRVLSHIAYELARRIEGDPSISNEELFRQVEWVLLLLGAGDALLTPERQRGLVGECVFLRRLLIVGRANKVPPSTVLSRWWGHQPARRDFAAEGIAVEVKTTSLNSRQHHIGSIEQLDPQSPGESVYLYSLGIKSDASSSRKLSDFVADVIAQLVTHSGDTDDAAVEIFQAQLQAYGYDRSRESAYAGGPGYLKPHLAGALFREDDLARIRYGSFVGGILPEMVRSVSYTLDVTCDPVSDEEAELVLRRLVLAATVSHQ